MKRILTLNLLLVIAKLAFGQQILYISEKVGKDTLQLHQENEIPIRYYSFSNDTLDLKAFKQENPLIRHVIQDKYPVQLPDLSAWRDSAFGVAYLTWGEMAEGDLIIFLVGNRNSPSPAFMLDENLDYDFGNDGPEFHFREKERRYHVKIQNEGWKKRKYQFWLIAPEELPEVRERIAYRIASAMEETPAAPVKVPKEHIASKINLRFEFGLLGGGSRLGYRYIDYRISQPVTYNAFSTEKGLLAGIEYRPMGFRLRAVTGFEHVYYWSSSKVTQLGDPYWLCGPGGTNCQFIENRIEERNLDYLPRFRMTASILGGYAFDLGNTLKLQPMVGLAWQTYFGQSFYPKKAEANESYAMDHAVFFQIGGQFDFRISERSDLFLRGTYLKGKFKPEGLYDALPLRSLTTWHKGMRFELGTSFALF